MPADFDKQQYWHDRFATETSFEWLTPSATFVSILEPQLSGLDKVSAQILHLGSGTSDLQTRLRLQGFLNVTNVDYEPLAIARGRQAEQAAFGDVAMAYVVADVTQLALPREYDLVVDKSTADAVSCAGEEALLRMARGVRRCLAGGGVWVSLSYSASRFAVEGLPFDVEIVEKIPTPKIRPGDPDVFHWCFLLRPR